MDVRTSEGIPTVERSGDRRHQRLGTSEFARDLFSPEHTGFGALRLFDEVSLDAGSSTSFQAHGGLETIVYVLQGSCQVARDGDKSIELRRGVAASIMGGHGVRYDVHNRGANALQLFVAAVVAPRSDARSRFTTKAFDPDAPGLVWVAAPAGGDQGSGPIPIHSTTRVGVASLAPGVEIKFSSAIERGLYVNVILGNIELNTGFLERGSDAEVSLEAKGARIQGVTHARVVILDVPMAFVQELA